MLHYSLLAGLSDGPLTLQRLIQRIPEDQWDQRLAPGRFSPREVMAHLVDIEPRLLERLRIGVEAPGTVVPFIDEDALAISGEYFAKDPVLCAAQFVELRAISRAYLSELTPEQLDQTLIHPETGPLKVLEQIWIFVGHDLYHINQLVEHLVVG